MIEFHSNLFFGRIAVLALVLVQIGLWWLFIVIYWKHQRNPMQRIVMGFPILCVMVANVLVQMNVYTKITKINKPIDNDNFFFWVGILEWAVPVVCFFVVLLKINANKQNN